MYNWPSYKKISIVVVECPPTYYRELVTYLSAGEEEIDGPECTLVAELEPFNCVRECNDAGYDGTLTLAINKMTGWLSETNPVHKIFLMYFN